MQLLVRTQLSYSQLIRGVQELQLQARNMTEPPYDPIIIQYYAATRVLCSVDKELTTL